MSVYYYTINCVDGNKIEIMAHKEFNINLALDKDQFCLQDWVLGAEKFEIRYKVEIHKTSSANL